MTYSAIIAGLIILGCLVGLSALALYRLCRSLSTASGRQHLAQCLPWKGEWHDICGGIVKEDQTLDDMDGIESMPMWVQRGVTYIASLGKVKWNDPRWDD